MRAARECDVRVRIPPDIEGVGAFERVRITVSRTRPQEYQLLLTDVLTGDLGVGRRHPQDANVGPASRATSSIAVLISPRSARRRAAPQGGG